MARGAQLSTIGGGNHFIELGVVDRIFDPAAAAKLGLGEGQLTVLIHTGSRGFGHQICTDFTALMLKAAAKMKLEIPTKGLAAVPIKSAEGQRYLAAMACAVNFAFCNRQWITHDVRQAFSAVLGGDDCDYDLGLVYDVAHNIATVSYTHLDVYKRQASLSHQEVLEEMARGKDSLDRLLMEAAVEIEASR